MSAVLFRKLHRFKGAEIPAKKKKNQTRTNYREPRHKSNAPKVGIPVPKEKRIMVDTNYGN